ncbi:MAG: flagellar hook-length control protein FliK [Phycisphaerae bacterium]|nr:flagellar hook-length control protein FliK [Phycisphaerae bacterium]
MDNMIASATETFIPPRADSAPQKSIPMPSRNRQEFSPAERSRTETPERSAETPLNADEESQVSSGDTGDRRDFNEVLEKKMAKSENVEEGNDVKNHKPDDDSAEAVPPGILIAETKIPEEIVNKGISPLINFTQAKQNGQSAETTGVIDSLSKNPVTQNLAKATGDEEIVTPVDKIPANVEEAKTETTGIPIITIADKPVVKQPVVNLTQPTEKNQPKIDQPKIDQPEAAQAVSKTLQNSENQQAADKNPNLSQVEQNIVNAQGPKPDQKTVVPKSENVPQAGFQNKFDESIEKAQSDVPSKASITSAPETNIETNINTALTPKGTVEKDLHKNLTGESRSERDSQTLGQISPASDNKTVTGNTARLDVKPQPTNDILNQVTEQIRSSMTRGREQISIALDPPELGRVMIKFQQRNGEIVGIVEVDKARTHREIADEMPMIVKSLNDSGIAVKKVEVVLTEQQTQDTLSDNSAKGNNNTGRNGFGGSSDNPQSEGSENGGRNFSRQYNPANNTDNYTNTVSDDAINMYA